MKCVCVEIFFSKAACIVDPDPTVCHTAVPRSAIWIHENMHSSLGRSLLNYYGDVDLDQKLMSS